MKEFAELFYEQCAGQYSGHMSMIPNNSVLHSMMRVANVRDHKSFAAFLRKVADELENKQDPMPY